MRLSENLARAIIEMDNIAWSEGLGPSECYEVEWDDLLVEAESVAGTLSDRSSFFNKVE
jgi:hypothetical protein